jgi:hypothetical protein
MSDRRNLDAQMPGLLESAAPQPPRDLDGAAIRSASTHRGSRSVSRRATPIIAAVLAVTVAVTLALLTGHGPTSRERDDNVSSPGTIAAANAQRRAETASALDRLLAAFSVPAAWRPSSRSLSKDLSLPRDDTTSYLVSRARLWVTTDAADRAMTYVSSHLPPDVVAGNSGGVTKDFASALFTPVRRWSQSADFAGPSISVVVERLRSGLVGVDIEASAYWLPLRTSDQIIPASVTGVSVTIRSTTPGKLVHRGHLGAADARTLARDINRLAVTYQAPSTCPVSGPSATLTFAGPAGPQIVTVGTYCPGGVFVRARHSTRYINLKPGQVFASVLSMSHLPRTFGRR